MGNPGLTAAQRDVYDAIVSYFYIHGQSPTTQEIADSLERGAVGTYRIIKRLEKKGYLKTSRYVWRSIEVVKMPVK